MEQTLTLEEKLVRLQNEVAPHREAIMDGKEDIEVVVRPMLQNYQLALVLNDTVECKGARYYLKTVARLIDPNCDRVIATTGEAEHIRKEDGEDNTGKASVLARVMALSGMFAL